MQPSSRLAILLCIAGATVAWQDFPSRRLPGVTHESFCLPSAAVTRKPLVRSRPYYDSTVPPLSFSTFWAHPTQLVVSAVKAWMRKGWEYVLDYQNPLREDECPITGEYDWRLADYTVEPRGRAWHDFQELSQAMRKEGMQALPSVGRTRQACDYLLGCFRQHLDTAVSSVLYTVGRLLVMLRVYVLETTWMFVSGVVRWVVGGVTAVVAGFLDGAFQIVQAAWVLVIAMLRFRYQVVVLAWLAMWNVVAGTVLAVLAFWGSLGRDILRGSAHYLVEAEDRVVVAAGGGLNTARNAVIGGTFTVLNSVVGGIVKLGDAVTSGITNVRDLIMGTWVSSKAFVWTVRQAIVLTIWRGQQSIVQAVVYFVTSVRHGVTSTVQSAMRTAQGLVPRMPRTWRPVLWSLIARIDTALPWIIATVSCVFGCLMWWRARQALAVEAAAAARIGRGGAMPGPTRGQEEEEKEEKKEEEEEAMGVPRANAAIRRALPPLPLLVPSLAPQPQPPTSQMPAEQVVERRSAGEEEKEEEEEEWLLISRVRHRHVARRTAEEQIAPTSPARVRGREETTTVTATRRMQTEEVTIEEATAPRQSAPPSTPSPPTQTARLPPRPFTPSTPPPERPPRQLIPLNVLLPFVCAVWGVEHPDMATVCACMGPQRWDEFVALYRQDFADRGLDTEAEVAKLEARPDGRYYLPADEVRYLLHPPDSDVSHDEFSLFCTAVEAASYLLERERKPGEEEEERATVGEEEVGQV